MNSVWTSFEEAQQVVGHASDPRPAWLWTGDGARLVWHNHAATLFGAKIKGDALKRAEDPQPIKGQIARILRIGLTGRPMLSRVQFIAGRKPLSATCMCTPLNLGGERPHILIVGIDPIASDIMERDPLPALEEEPTVPEGLTDPEPEVTEPTPEALRDDGDDQAPNDPADDENLDSHGLSRLIDKLADDERLFAPLTEDEDEDLPPLAQEEPDAPVPPRDFARIAHDETIEGEQHSQSSDWHEEDASKAEEAAFAADIDAESHDSRTGLWQVTGRGLSSADAQQPEPEPEPEASAQETEPQAAAPAEMDRVSRYNFEELSRILTDRVSAEAPPVPQPDQPEPPETRGGALVTLGEEAPVLNRLPLGILIFRDQEIVFANRALVDLTGHENATRLRALGLSSVFPDLAPNEAVGPVNQLRRRDGTNVAVSARLQSVSWRGKSALMLSASLKEPVGQSDGAVRRFAALWAQSARQVFFETDIEGTVTQIVTGGNQAPAPLAMGEPISSVLDAAGRARLGDFFATTGPFTEDARPTIALAGRREGETLTLFAEGEGDSVTGYFGVIDPARPTATQPPQGLPAQSLSRISRELRRPLNTISGFSELIATEAFGPIDNPRYLEYARDIRAAGGAISALADELDDFVRLTEGRMRLKSDDVDLAGLLDECFVRIRGAAGSARVLLRSAVSEQLPLVRADRATLRQAVLNMLASAIHQAGEGSKVVMSAQREADGAVTVHVRDRAKAPGTLAEHFVVYREGSDARGQPRLPMASSIGLTLTRSLAAVNACSLRLDPAPEQGTLMTLTIPATLVIEKAG